MNMLSVKNCDAHIYTRSTGYGFWGELKDQSGKTLLQLGKGKMHGSQYLKYEYKGDRIYLK